jgi:hypothetical protein
MSEFDRSETGSWKFKSRMAEDVMRRLRTWLLRLGEPFGRERRERELAAEMESHLRMHIEDNLRERSEPFAQ